MRVPPALLSALLLLAACGSDKSPPPAADAVGDAGPPAASDAGSSTPDPGKDAGTTTPPAKVKATNETVMVGARSRTYVLVVPLAYDAARKYPLVVSLHGQPGNGTQFRAASPFEATSEDDAIVAYPDGIGGEWDLVTPAANNVDVPFMEAMIAAIAAKVSIDPQKVFGTGYSNGAFFLSAIGCKKTGIFKGFALHAGGAPFDLPENAPQFDADGFLVCPGGGPTPTIVFHGDGDGVVEPSSGDFAAKYWAHANGCQASRSASSPAPCVQHDGCPGGRPVTYCPIPGLGHTVWSEGNKVSWAFFKTL